MGEFDKLPDNSTRQRNGAWVCLNCGNVEKMEREVMCWDCWNGEMVYVENVSEAGYVRLKQR